MSQRCPGCDEACRLDGRVAQRFPVHRVRVVDLERELAARPTNLVAVPSYMLDGHVLALGNPREEDLLQCLAQSLDREERHGLP